jgi:hypothetical protein
MSQCCLRKDHASSWWDMVRIRKKHEHGAFEHLALSLIKCRLQEADLRPPSMEQSLRKPTLTIFPSITCGTSYQMHIPIRMSISWSRLEALPTQCLSSKSVMSPAKIRVMTSTASSLNGQTTTVDVCGMVAAKTRART